MILGYCRVSTLEQAGDDRTSLQVQENVIRGFAMARGVDKFGIQIYTDAGVSGATPLRYRDAGSQLLADARPGDFIVASKLDRIFRSCRDALECAEKWHADGIKLVLYDLGAEPVLESPTAKFFFAVMSAAAGLERDTIAERMKSGKRAKKANGGHAGGRAPYGYKIVGYGRQAKLEVNPDEVEAMAQIRMHANRCGRSPYMTARLANIAGLPTRTGQPWLPIQVKRILEKPIQ